MTVPIMRSSLGSFEIVAETIAVGDGTLRDQRNAVAPRRLLLAGPVPVDGHVRTGHAVFDIDHDFIA